MTIQAGDRFAPRWQHLRDKRMCVCDSSSVRQLRLKQATHCVAESSFWRWPVPSWNLALALPSTPLDGSFRRWSSAFRVRYGTGIERPRWGRSDQWSEHAHHRWHSHRLLYHGQYSLECTVSSWRFASQRSGQTGPCLPAIVAAVTGVATDPTRPSVLSVAGLPDAVAPTDYTVSGDLDNGVIEAVPQTTGGVKVPVTKQMTAPQVRDAIRQALADTFSDPDTLALVPAPAGNPLDVWKFTGNTLVFHKFDISNNDSAMGLTTERVGDYFGVNPSTLVVAKLAWLTWTNARRITLAKVCTSTTLSSVLLNAVRWSFRPRRKVALRPISNTQDVVRCRTNRERALSIDRPHRSRLWGVRQNYRSLALTRQFNTNDRLSQQVGIEVDPNALRSITDGATFTLTDGARVVTFEFDVYDQRCASSRRRAAGNVPVSIASNATRGEIALAIRDAINSPTVQSLLKVTASLQGEMTYGTSCGDMALTDGTIVHLHGQLPVESMVVYLPQPTLA